MDLVYTCLCISLNMAVLFNKETTKVQILVICNFGKKIFKHNKKIRIKCTEISKP